MKNHIMFIFLGAALLYTSTAAAVSITYEEGTIWYIDSVVCAGTYGDDMEGMEVSVTFSDGTMETAVWQSLGSGSGGAFGNNWSLQVENGSTYPNSSHFSPWAFESDTAITSLTLDAGSGDFVFDGTRTYASNPILYPSTPNSGSGWPFEFADLLSESLFDSSTLATYSNAVALVGTAPVDDLYRTLTIEPNLSSWTGPMSFTFSADTDTVNPAPVPEPASMILMGTGLAGLTALRRRSKKKTGRKTELLDI
ncbi:hypothetical protein GF1_03160 [Desulfolithobacter dissulfuricans]|uniref:Ice-binding protein C-terminal domain-containing protein n=1 Tax=Desulfolithobacter dissulfuricans TaxID=2795293 RepID=A0A915U922_9BACT|nr:PEP-CTERM sorting domain-containing protein [Desulfolithobacter dissulfuricans]BCO07940.1 hypothetical protein GF1_03160 [Desulfolithobacter dissulfuricans]